MSRLPLCLALSVALTAPVSARADASCAPVISAFEKLASAPAYRQLTRAFGRKPMTSLAIGQKFYVQNEGEWQALELKPGERQSMMKSAVGAGMKDCVQKSDETYEGDAVKVYAYAPPKELEDQGAGEQTVWVGAKDGLPRRIFSERSEIQLSYGDITPPPVGRQ
ncbi:hypothetical protein IHQ68_15615 [Chelatococcus sambhunathii]|uniref:Uncharacterized protein n=1 Tax=Chelatococcus sambhunathii TaxID=363953 RepID=A0ABU1DJ62_9HYPH|nr:hypothetical protein [Chelatococcus sambhunathii]MDR4308050.1 hypothetical protein [Chelatococcus sambhunathii]